MEDLYKLIEDYLNDALPEEQRREVERRMESDEDFQREVALHRAMQDHFGDASGWHLYTSITEIMQEPIPADDSPPDGKPGDSSGRRWQWWWAIPAVFMALAGVWYFSRPAERMTPPQPVQVPPTKPAPPATQPIAAEKDSQSVVNPEDKRFFAKADPADFVPNNTMEVYIESKTLGPEEISLQVTAPQNLAVFYPDKTGQTRLRFAGSFSGLPPNEKTAFDLLIFDNKNDNKALMTIPLQVSADAAGAAAFDLRNKVVFRLGLYYYQIEEKESGAVLMTGKFFIGKQ